MYIQRSISRAFQPLGRGLPFAWKSMGLEPAQVLGSDVKKIQGEEWMNQCGEMRTDTFDTWWEWADKVYVSRGSKTNIKYCI